MLHDQRSSRHQPLQRLLLDFLASADWATLCQRLLPLLPDKGLMQVAHILADDLHSLHQAQQQQQQGRQRSNSSLLGCWCRDQSTHSAQLSPVATAATGGTAGDHQHQQVLAALQAAATPAVQLPCVSQPHMLLLGCLQSSQQGGFGYAYLFAHTRPSLGLWWFCGAILPGRPAWIVLYQSALLLVASCAVSLLLWPGSVALQCGFCCDQPVWTAWHRKRSAHGN